MSTSRDRARRLAGRGLGRPITPGTRAELDDAIAEVAELLAEPMTSDQHAALLADLDQLCVRVAAIVGLPEP